MNAIDIKEWKPVAFGDMCSNLNETERDPLANGIERYVGLEHIEPGNLHINSWGNVSDGTTFTKKFRKGQVLFGKRRAYLRKAAVAEFDGICSGDILVFDAKDRVIDPRLLPFIVSSDKFFEYAIQTSAGSLSPRTKFQDLSKLKFLLPPKDQQAKLAELLWTADEVAEKYSVIKSNLLIAKESLRISAFKKYNGPFEKAHELVKLTAGGTPSTHIPEYWENGSIKWMSSGDVHLKVIHDVEGRITEEGLKNSSTKLIPINSVVIALAGQGKTKGTVAITKTELCTNQSVAAFLPNEKVILPEFLYHYLDSIYNYFREITGDTNSRTGLNLAILKNLSIPKMKFSEQLSITHKFNTIDSEIGEIEAHIDQSKSLTKQLINQIFS